MTNELNKNKQQDLKKMKLIIGSVLFVFMVIMHAAYEVNIWLVAVPGALMGIDPSILLPNKQ